jgi:hypothetical protein
MNEYIGGAGFPAAATYEQWIRFDASHHAFNAAGRIIRFGNSFPAVHA